jgi:serine/threonine-protein kinase
MAVPNVLGQSERAAEINLARRGLQIGMVTTIHLPGAEPDTVLAQSPTADQEGLSSPKVNLVVAADDADAQALVMPDLVGRSLDDATRVIVGAGLRLGDVATVRTQAPAAGEKTLPTLPIVAKQVPAAGQKIQPGAAVNVQVVR